MSAGAGKTGAAADGAGWSYPLLLALAYFGSEQPLAIDSLQLVALILGENEDVALGSNVHVDAGSLEGVGLVGAEHFDHNDLLRRLSGCIKITPRKSWSPVEGKIQTVRVHKKLLFSGLLGRRPTCIYRTGNLARLTGSPLLLKARGRA